MLPSYSSIIIARRRFGHWLSWFENSPREKFAGESVWTAVTILLDAAGWDRLSLEQAYERFESQSDCSELRIVLRLTGIQSEATAEFTEVNDDRPRHSSGPIFRAK